MANLVELLNKESVRMTERVMPGLILSLQGLWKNELGTVWYNFYISRYSKNLKIDSWLIKEKMNTGKTSI